MINKARRLINDSRIFTGWNIDPRFPCTINCYINVPRYGMVFIAVSFDEKANFELVLPETNTRYSLPFTSSTAEDVIPTLLRNLVFIILNSKEVLKKDILPPSMGERWAGLDRLAI